MLALAGLPGVLPTEQLLLHWRPLRLGLDGVLRACAVKLAEGVTTGHECDGLLVVHGHAAEGLADVTTGSNRVGVCVRAFWVDVDQTHLHCAERLHELSVAAVTLVVQPNRFRSPVDVLFRSPDILAATSEAERLETHRLESHVARQDHEVGPGERTTVLLLDGFEQSSRLVEVAVVGPAVEGSEALRSGGSATTPIVGAVGTG